MKELLFSSFFEDLGFVLLHSLWQGAMAFVLILVLNKIINDRYSVVKYWLNVAILFLFVFVNISTSFYSNDGSGIVIAENSSQLIVSGSGASTTLQNLASISQISGLVNLITPYFMLFWLAGVFIMLIRIMLNLYQIDSLKRRNLVFVNDELAQVLDNLSTRMGIDRVIKLAESSRVSTPSILGHFKPIILFPVGFLSGLSNDQIEAILLHELSHIKRGDFLLNLLQSTVEIVYFFNPFMWLISKKIRILRENASDDEVLKMGISKSTYVKTLAEVFEYAFYQNKLSINLGNNKNTLKRIHRIMKTESNNNNFTAGLVFLLAVSVSIYFTSESQASQEMAFSEPDYLVMASPIPNLLIDPVPIAEVEVIKVPAPVKVVAEPFPADTIGPKEMKKRAEEFEKALEKLHSSKEWQEMEKVRAKMLEEQMEYLHEISPEIEKALHAAEKSFEIDEIEMAEIEKRIAEVNVRMNELNIDQELELALEINARAMEEAMATLEIQLSKMDFSKMEELAKIYSDKAREFEIDAEKWTESAEKLAAEAERYVAQMESFMEELKPVLVRDGYLKKGEELDDVRFKDDRVWINDTEVEASDAKKYIKIKDKYFPEGEDFNIN